MLYIGVKDENPQNSQARLKIGCLRFRVRQRLPSANQQIYPYDQLEKEKAVELIGRVEAPKTCIRTTLPLKVAKRCRIDLELAEENYCDYEQVYELLVGWGLKNAVSNIDDVIDEEPSLIDLDSVKWVRYPLTDASWCKSGERALNPNR